MPISANVTNRPIAASVGETQIDVSVGSPQVSASVSGGFGPSGVQGPSGVVTVSAPVTNSGTSSAANIGLAVGTGLSTAGGSLVVTYGTTAGTACQGNDARLSDARTPLSHTHTASQITDFTTAVIAAAPPTTNASLLTSGTLPDARLSSNIARTTDVSSAVAALVNSAPATLDTLAELASALGSDANFSTTVTNSLASKAPINNPTFTGTVGGVTKSMVGLGNVDNTSDANKPVSTATQTALDGKAASSHNHDASAINAGTLSADRLPLASANTRGAVRIGTGISIDGDGVISASGGGGYDQSLNKADSPTFAGLTLTGQSTGISYNDLNDLPSLFDGSFAALTGIDGEANAGYVLTADGAGGAAWADGTSSLVAGEVSLTFYENGGLLFPDAIGEIRFPRLIEGEPDPIEGRIGFDSDNIVIQSRGSNNTIRLDNGNAEAGSGWLVCQRVYFEWPTESSYFDGSYGSLTGLPELGDAATLNVGTAANTVAAGDDARFTDARTPTSHSHGNLTNDGAIGTTSGLVVTTGASGVLGALTLGSAGHVLTVNSKADGVEWAAASGGGTVTIDATAADVLTATSGTISADDPGADRIVFWDDSAGKLAHLEVSTGLAISGTAISLASHSHSASDVTSGTLDAARLPLATTTTAGAVIVGTGLGVTSGTISVTQFTVRSDVVSSTAYTGRAVAGSATSASVWTIRRSVYTSAGAVSSTATATNVKWDDRLTATYS